MQQTVTSSVDLEEWFLARKKIYQLLGLFFRQPLDLIMVIDLKRAAGLEVLQQIFEGAVLIVEYVDNCSEEQINIERQAFETLFGVAGSSKAPPCESCYRSREGLYFSEITLAVRQKYRRNGLKLRELNRYPDDHLLAELEFMQWLIDKYDDAMPQRETTELIGVQLDFLEHHLSVWVPHFVKRVVSAETSVFYRGAAVLLGEFIEFDRGLLADLKEEMING